jgi:hypothetical protein
MKVKTNHDESVDFSKYDTFKILEEDKANPITSMKESTRRIIEQAIGYELRNRGFLDSSNPELLVYFQTVVKGKNNVSDYGSYYQGRYERSLPTSSTDANSSDFYVHDVTEGTLIIDIIDSKNEKVIWQGVVTKALKSDQEDVDVQGIVYDAVEMVFKDFPPEK